VLSLLPRAATYRATGINDHAQYFGSGFKELPNGIAFGGQVGHFGLYVDDRLEGGHSRPNATYAR
jgi:hypothetical protein